MADKERKEFAFIQEKIKERPLNKKRLFKYGVITVGFAVLFGLVACFVFTLTRPVMENWLYPKEDPTISIPEDEWDDTEELAEKADTEFPEEDSNEPEPETETEPEEAAPVQETVIVKELELSDYQQLQNKVYAIGKEANRSIVTVTGVVSDTDRKSVV